MSRHCIGNFFLNVPLNAGSCLTYSKANCASSLCTYEKREFLDTTDPVSTPATSMLRPLGYAWRGHLRKAERSRRSKEPCEARRAKHGLNGTGFQRNPAPPVSGVYAALPACCRRSRQLPHALRLPGAKRKQSRTNLHRYTANLRARLCSHNAGRSPHTSKFRPWQLITCLAFSTKTRALDFESYLKSHSGMAFASKRLW